MGISYLWPVLIKKSFSLDRFRSGWKQCHLNWLSIICFAICNSISQTKCSSNLLKFLIWSETNLNCLWSWRNAWLDVVRSWIGWMQWTRICQNMVEGAFTNHVTLICFHFSFSSTKAARFLSRWTKKNKFLFHQTPKFTQSVLCERSLDLPLNTTSK